jgi:hypothetical protein
MYRTSYNCLWVICCAASWLHVAVPTYPVAIMIRFVWLPLSGPVNYALLLMAEAAHGCNIRLVYLIIKYGSNVFLLTSYVVARHQ